MRDGVGYLPAALRDVRVAPLRARCGGADVGADGAQRDAIALVKPADIDFTARLRAAVDAWLQVGVPCGACPSFSCHRTAASVAADLHCSWLKLAGSCTSHDRSQLQRIFCFAQGDEETLLLEQVNGYLRRLQYQHLGTRGNAASTGFVIEVHRLVLAPAI